MNELKNRPLFNTLSMSPEEINFILLEPSLEEIYSAQQKKTVQSEMVDILKRDLSKTLLLPFNKPDSC
jgi:hypothetical protein